MDELWNFLKKNVNLRNKNEGNAKGLFQNLLIVKRRNFLMKQMLDCYEILQIQIMELRDKSWTLTKNQMENEKFRWTQLSRKIWIWVKSQVKLRIW